MKRDMDVIRLLLLQLEGNEKATETISSGPVRASKDGRGGAILQRQRFCHGS
jgi:hypothetical protein